jgi:hypothetical protein
MTSSSHVGCNIKHIPRALEKKPAAAPGASNETGRPPVEAKGGARHNSTAND